MENTVYLRKVLDSLERARAYGEWNEYEWARLCKASTLVNSVLEEYPPGRAGIDCSTGKVMLKGE